MLEMFNTLLRQLRLSIDYVLTGSYDGAISLGTKIIKEHEERMFQEAVIKTIGGPRERWGPGGLPGQTCGRRGRWAVPIPPRRLVPGVVGLSSTQRRVTASLVAQLVKNPPTVQETWVRSLGWGRSPGEGHGSPFQYSCLENLHGQRSLEGCSPRGRKESDTAERLSTHAHTSC